MNNPSQSSTAATKHNTNIPHFAKGGLGGISLLTDHLDIWTAADTEKKTGRGRSAGNAASVYGIKKLRELILELAVRGKLVPQDVNDEPASELLKRIQSEKAELIAESKIKKEKPFPPLSDIEMLFELPKGWAWVRLGDLVDPSRSITYGVLKPGNNVSDGVPLVKTENVFFNRITEDFSSRISPELDAQYKRTKLLGGEILLTLVGSIGRCAIAPLTLAGANLSRSVGMIVPISILNKSYLVLSITEAINEDYINKNCAGTAQLVLNVGVVNDLIIALPPIEEQNRIVAKVDELMALCDQLETQHNNAAEAHEKLVSHLLGTLTQSQNTADFSANWQRIVAHFDTLFTTESSLDALKQTLLQLAVMGKLVPQDPNDEPASELLKRIQVEKTKLISERKIKKEKPLPPIIDEEKPFGLPKGWEWVRLGNLGLGSTGKTPSTGVTEYYGGNTPFIGPGQITPTGEIIDSDKSLTDTGCEYSTVAEPGDVLMVCIGGSIGKSAITVTRVAFNQQINCIRPIFVSPVLLNYSMSTQYFQTAVLENATGSATPIINRSKWEELLVAVPPEAEQHRINTKVEELIALCDQLKSRIKSANQFQHKLADVLVEQAVA